MKPKARALKEACRKADADFAEYQRKCKHEHTKEQHCSSDDDGGVLNTRHWKDITCLDCGKRWSVR